MDTIVVGVLDPRPGMCTSRMVSVRPLPMSPPVASSACCSGVSSCLLSEPDEQPCCAVSPRRAVRGSRPARGCGAAMCPPRDRRLPTATTNTSNSDDQHDAPPTPLAPWLFGRRRRCRSEVAGGRGAAGAGLAAAVADAAPAVAVVAVAGAGVVVRSSGCVARAVLRWPRRPVAAGRAGSPATAPGDRGGRNSALADRGPARAAAGCRPQQECTSTAPYCSQPSGPPAARSRRTPPRR